MKLTKEVMMRLRPLLLGCLLALFGVAAAAAPAGKTTAVTIDFSAVGITQDYFDPLFFKSDGFRLAESYYIQWIQGDDAIGGTGAPVKASFTRPATAITVSFALAVQGTGHYTLTAYGGSGRVVASKTLTVTQSSATNPGYVTLTLDNLGTKAKSFLFDGVDVGYGVNTITYRYD